MRRDFTTNIKHVLPVFTLKNCECLQKPHCVENIRERSEHLVKENRTKLSRDHKLTFA